MRWLWVCLAAISLFSVDAVETSFPDFPSPVALPPPVQEVVFQKELLSQHPRIFLDASGVSAIREKVKNPAVAPVWSYLLEEADQIAEETPPAKPMSEDDVRMVGNRMWTIAFAYLITQDPKYLEGSLKWIHAIESYPTWAGDVDLGAAHVTFGMSLAYDWLYNALSPQDRQQMEATLLQHGRLLLTRSIKWPHSWWGNAYFQNHCWINHTGISTAAMALYDTNPDEMQTWLDFARTRFETTYRHLGVDSSYHEGPAYLAYGAQWILFYIESLRSISGEDLSDMPLFRNLTKHLLDATMPDGRNIGNFGDSDAIPWGIPDDSIFAWLAAHQKDGHAEWMRQRGRAAFVQRPPYESPFAFILWVDPSISPVPPDNLPTCGLYPDRGLVVFRSSWKEDAAVVQFLCGPPGGHHIVDQWSSFPDAAPTFGHSHPDANSFLFFSDRQWRIGNPGGYTHNKQTHNENVWTMGGKGQRGEGEMWFEADSYFVPHAPQAHLVRVATSPAADYVVGEAAPAYDSACKLLEFRRHLLFIKHDQPYVVVLDRLKAGEPKKWASFLHTFGNIEVHDLPKPIQRKTSGSSSAKAFFDSKEFQSQGSPPPTESWAALPSLPQWTPSFGTLFGPSGLTVESHPLNVVGHPDNQPENRGFELVAKTAAPSESTWLIMVIGVENHPVILGGTAETPSIMVANDRIAWDGDGNVSFNGNSVDGNLLPKDSCP